MLIDEPEGRQIVVGAHKAGDVFGLDPESGTLLWRRKISAGDFNLGVLFGMAEERGRVYASVMDLDRNPQNGPYWGIEELGLYAVHADTGEPLWKAAVSSQCSGKKPCRGYSAALTAIPGVLFASSKDGYLRALQSDDGHLIWEFNTAREFRALNGETAQGGDMDGPGAVVADGMVYVNSGYASGYSALQPGNAFLAFSVDGQ